MTARVLNDLRALQAMGTEPAPLIFTKMLAANRIAVMLAMCSGPYKYTPLFFTIEPGVQFAGTEHPYPACPPRVLHFSPHEIYLHPNLYTLQAGGKVCLSILGTWAGPGWTSAMNFEQIMTMIAALLHRDAIQCEPAYENAKPDRAKAYAQSNKGCLLRSTARLLLRAHNDDLPTLVLPDKKQLDLRIFTAECKYLYQLGRAYYYRAATKFPPGMTHYHGYNRTACVHTDENRTLELLHNAGSKYSIIPATIRIVTTLPVETTRQLAGNNPNYNVQIAEDATATTAHLHILLGTDPAYTTEYMSKNTNTIHIQTSGLQKRIESSVCAAIAERLVASTLKQL